MTLPAVERPQLPLDPWWLLTGFWYALGKDGGVVTRVADTLIHYAHDLTPQERRMIVEDITNHIERRTAGGPVSVERWRRVKAVMSHG